MPGRRGSDEPMSRKARSNVPAGQCWEVDSQGLICEVALCRDVARLSGRHAAGDLP